MAEDGDRYTVYVVDVQSTYREIHENLTRERLLWLLPFLVGAGIDVNWTIVIRRVQKVL